jgi:hypothetical protein
VLTFLEGDKIRHAVLPLLVSRLLTRLTPNAKSVSESIWHISLYVRPKPRNVSHILVS